MYTLPSMCYQWNSLESNATKCIPTLSSHLEKLSAIASVEAKMMLRYFDAWMSDYSSMEHPLASLKARRFPDAFQ